MGEVYKARDTRLDRTVAIKVLPTGVAPSAEQRQRFEREARAISKLSHPHVCALYDVGREGETEYLVMEYLEGEIAGGPARAEARCRSSRRCDTAARSRTPWTRRIGRGSCIEI